MSLMFMDSCGDHYSATQVGWKYQYVTSEVTVGSGTGRRGTNSLRQVSVGGSAAAIRVIEPAQSALVVGFALCLSALLTGSQRGIVALRSDGDVQVDLRGQSDGSLQITRNGTNLGSTTQALTPGTYAYIEWQTLIAPSGTTIVRVNEQTWLSLTGVNTQATGSASVNQVRFGASANAGVLMDYDDIYILNYQGSEASTFLGNVRVDPLWPISQGTMSFWEPSLSAVCAVSLVQELTPDSDGTYLTTSAVCAMQRFVLSAFLSAPSVSIYGIQVNLAVLQTSTGTRWCAAIGWYSTTSATYSAQGLHASMFPSAYVYLCQPFSGPPEREASGLSWVASFLSNTEFGIKLTR